MSEIYYLENRGVKFACVQLFDQQFAHVVNGGYTEEKFIQRIKSDLAREWASRNE